METSDYLKAFFEEKQVTQQNFEIKDKQNTTHFINTDVVIEHIMNTSASEQTRIANVLRQIDFRNGSISHFLKFLAHTLVQQYSTAL
ncbi:MAG: hypothetical protein WAQ28_12975 [Bacteroidia bacterium]